MLALRSLRARPASFGTLRPSLPAPGLRTLAQSSPARQQQQPAPPDPSSYPAHEPPRYNFYRTHGRAFFKSFTLAFLTYQLVHWAWLLFETEEERDQREAQIKSLEGEVRLLDEGRGSHVKPAGSS